MAHTIIERPATFCFSKNSIRYIYSVDNLARQGLMLEVQIMFAMGNSNTYAELHRFKLKPSTDGSVIVSFNSWIDSVLQYKLPVANITHADTQYCSFYINTREVTDDDTNPAYNTHESTKPRIALKGGLELNRSFRNSFFIHHLNDKKFFTFTPPDTFIFPHQPKYISFLYFNGNPSTAVIKGTLYFTDGSTDVRQMAIAQTGYLFHCNISFSAFGFIIPANKTPYRLSVAVFNDINEIVIGPQTYFFELHPNYGIYALLWVNSLGGWESTSVNYNLQYGVDVTSTESSVLKNAGDFNATFKSSPINTYQVSGVKIYSGVIETIRTPEEKEALQDILYSRLVYQQFYQQWIKISNNVKKSRAFELDATVFSLPLEWQLSEVNDVFTPSFVQLPNVTDTETYP